MLRAPLSMLLAVTLVVGGASAVSTEGVDCGAAVPCGPIPVIISIKLDKTRDLDWDASNQIRLEGSVTYYFDVDQDGHGFNPQELPRIVFKTPRKPDWVTVAVDPPELGIPVNDAAYVAQEDPGGSQPEQTKFEYKQPITVTLTKDYEPEADEMLDQLRSDGRYRVLLAGVSNPSMVNQAGYQLGLMEGYGVRELRINPGQGIESMSTDSNEGGSSPGVPAIAGLLAIAAGAWATRRRD